MKKPGHTSKRSGTDNSVAKTVAPPRPSVPLSNPDCASTTKPETRREALLVEAERIAHLGSYEWDVGTDFVYRSEELCRVFGVTPEEFKPTFEGYLERVHPDGRARTRSIIENAYRQKIPFEFEERIVHPDGSIHDLHSQGKWIFDDAHNPVKLIGICQDITEQKFVNRLLSARNHVLECIASRLPLTEVLEEICRRIEALNPPVMASIMLLDPDGKHISPGAAPSLPERWVKAITHIAIGPATGSCGTAAFRREAVISEDISKDPFWTPYRDALNIALDCGLRACWSTPLISAENEVLGTFALYYKEPRKPTAHDMEVIHQVKRLTCVAIKHDRAAKAVLALNAELEERVQARTRELSIANRELEAFAAAASHDLRSPLKRMHAFAEILLDEHTKDLPEEGKELATAIATESRRMHDLVEVLLKHSQAARARLHKEKVDLSKMAMEIAGDLRKQQPERSVDFAIEPGVVVNGDPVLLRLALQNLIDNAWKFTAKREHARIEFGVTQGTHPEIFVRDNGAGFDSSRAAEMFTPFQRLHSAEEFPGTGIGLATVHQIIFRHGGEIRAEGAPDKGATFFFTLPGS